MLQTHFQQGLTVHGMSPADMHAMITILRQSTMDPKTLSNVNSPDHLMQLVRNISQLNFHK